MVLHPDDSCLEPCLVLLVQFLSKSWPDRVMMGQFGYKPGKITLSYVSWPSKICRVKANPHRYELAVRSRYSHQFLAWIFQGVLRLFDCTLGCLLPQLEETPKWRLGLPQQFASSQDQVWSHLTKMFSFSKRQLDFKRAMIKTSAHFPLTGLVPQQKMGRGEHKDLSQESHNFQVFLHSTNHFCPQAKKVLKEQFFPRRNCI